MYSKMLWGFTMIMSISFWALTDPQHLPNCHTWQQLPQSNFYFLCLYFLIDFRINDLYKVISHVSLLPLSNGCNTPFGLFPFPFSVNDMIFKQYLTNELSVTSTYGHTGYHLFLLFNSNVSKTLLENGCAPYLIIKYLYSPLLVLSIGVCGVS